VYTLDVITPIVDDPRAFGRIAAANALSDVYAMNGDVQVALSFVGLPSELGLEVFHDVLYGAAEKATEAGCAIVGGHTIKDTEPKCGLAVIGSVPGDLWSHKGGRAGQKLVLTKPLGTGVVAQAIKKGAAEDAWIAAAQASMERLNAAARDAGRKARATAATDVTGFGFLGHLMHMVEASGVDARIDVAAVPLLPGARAAAEQGFVPGGTKRNKQYVDDALVGADEVDETSLMLLADAQTSGGLLLAVEESGVTELLQALPEAAVVGELTEPEGGNGGRLFVV
jgi:selenide,water dikinase